MTFASNQHRHATHGRRTNTALGAALLCLGATFALAVPACSGSNEDSGPSCSVERGAKALYYWEDDPSRGGGTRNIKVQLTPSSDGYHYDISGEPKTGTMWASSTESMGRRRLRHASELVI